MCEKTTEIIGNELIRALSDIGAKEKDHVVYNLKVGTAITFNVWKDDKMHVLRAFLSANTIFPLHQHELSFETLVTMDEESDVFVIIDDDEDGEKVKLSYGKAVTINPECPHFLHAKKDSWILATLIPPDAGMPQE